MKIIKDIAALQRTLAKAKKKNKLIGFVPTMGALHAGHGALLKKCRKENDVAVLSIFVNPTQFGPHEDFKNYPRQEKQDVMFAKRENVDIIFCPSINEVYPSRFLTHIQVDKISDVLCGKFRPGHFRGVATVVGKLLNIVAPDTLYLGQKDAQQCAVIQQMVNDLNFPVKIKVIPTVREPDGLAMSSRNRYLNPQERKEATILHRSLIKAQERILTGEQNPLRIVNGIRAMIRENSSGRIDYVECLQAETLEPLVKIDGKILIALAVWFGSARLIDNITLTVKHNS